MRITCRAAPFFDFKTINVGRGGLDGMQLPRQRHVKQLQIYAWLLAQNGYPPHPPPIRIAYMTMAQLRTEEVAVRDDLDQVHGWNPQHPQRRTGRTATTAKSARNVGM